MMKKREKSEGTKFIFFLVLGAALLLLWAGRADAVKKEVDTFEGYANTSELKFAWDDTEGAPARVLVTTVVYQGSKAMEYKYDVSGDPFFDGLTYTFSSNQDWSGYTSFTYWFTGVSGNSGEYIHLELQDASNATIGKDKLEELGADPWQPTKYTTWTKRTIDISAWTGRNAVRSIKVFIVAKDYGSGRVYFDDFAVNVADTEEILPSISRQKVFTPNGDGKNDYIIFDAFILTEPYTINIYDAVGKRVREITANSEALPFDRASWDGKDANGNVVKNGIYIYQIKALVGGVEKRVSGSIAVAK